MDPREMLVRLKLRMECVSLALLCLLVSCTVMSSSDQAFGDGGTSQLATAGPDVAGAGGRPPASPRWLRLGRRYVAFYPVWSSWSTARAACAESGGDLLSLHSSEERTVVHQLAGTHTPVWLGGFQDRPSGSWLWSDNSSISWMGQNLPQTPGGGGCLEMTPKDRALHSAHCEELHFYLCSSETDFLIQRNPVHAGAVAGVSVYDVLWRYGAPLAEEVLRSSSIATELQSGWLLERCYTRFRQQEALYLQRVSHTLKVLIDHLQGSDDASKLLVDTFKAYSSGDPSLHATPPPHWLRLSLQSFHPVVLEEPIYWLVALSARASLRNFLAIKLLIPGPALRFHPVVGNFYQRWGLDSMEEALWTHRFRNVLEEHHDHLDMFKAVNIFREHMTNQRNLYRAASCDEENGGW